MRLILEDLGLCTWAVGWYVPFADAPALNHYGDKSILTSHVTDNSTVSSKACQNNKTGLLWGISTSFRFPTKGQ